MKFIKLIICSFALISCVEEHLFPTHDAAGRVQKTFTADLSGQSKTMLVDGRKVHWTDGDMISIFDDENLANNPFSASQIDGHIADFTGYTTDDAEEYVAVYPYRYGTKYSDGAIIVRVPNCQKAVVGSFDTDLNITVAKTSDEHLSFKNVCALLKMNVPSEVTNVTGFTLASRVPLCGDMRVVFDEDGQPIMSPVNANSGKEIALMSADSPFAPGDYYFVVAPGEHKFQMGVATTESELYVVTSDHQIAIPANNVVNMGSVKAEFTKRFKVTNLPSAPLSLVDTWQLGFEIMDPECVGKTLKFVGRDANVVTSTTDGLVVFGKRPGTAMVNVEYDGVSCPILFDVRAWYKDQVTEWEHDTKDTPDAVVETASNSYGETYYRVTTDSKGKGYLKRSAKIWPSPKTSPILMVRADDVADKGYTRNIILNFSHNFTFNGTGFTGTVGNGNNKWVKKFRCSDGSSIFIYDLSTQKVGSRMLPEDFHADGNLQLKYADVKLNGVAQQGVTYRFWGFRSFGSMSDMEDYLSEWSEASGITYTEAGNSSDGTKGMFNHPCALVSADDIAQVQKSIGTASPSDPVYAAYLNFISCKYAQSSYTSSPVEILVRGDATGTGVSGENYMSAARDAAAAFQLALRWRISGDSKCADTAVEILNTWADVCTAIAANDNNQYLCAGFQGYTFANAAELLRDYSGWETSEQNDFKSWLRQVWLSKNEWFIDNHGGDGVCDLHYWSNWELANLASMLAIGIYLEDYELIDKVRSNFLHGSGSGCIDNMIPYAPVEDPDGYGMIAQNMESGRDQGHATLVVSLCAELCQMAWNIGLDFLGEGNNKIMAMSQYTAKYNVKPNGEYICSTIPFYPYSYCPSGCGCNRQDHGAEHVEISAEGRSTVRPCWDLIYSHYRHEKKVSDAEVHYVKLFADQLRYTNGILTGDGGAGDSRYGSNSGAFDQIGWGTMMFYRGE